MKRVMYKTRTLGNLGAWTRQRYNIVSESFLGPLDTLSNLERDIQHAIEMPSFQAWFWDIAVALQIPRERIVARVFDCPMYVEFGDVERENWCAAQLRETYRNRAISERKAKKVRKLIQKDLGSFNSD